MTLGKCKECGTEICKLDELEIYDRIVYKAFTVGVGVGTIIEITGREYPDKTTIIHSPDCGGDVELYFPLIDYTVR